MALEPGFKLGPYEVLSLLGAGGMGEVYRARDPRLGRTVAIKVLPGDHASDPDRLRRFEKEARAAGALNHPHILTVFDVGTHDGGPYLVSELLEGETLRARLRSGGLSVTKALEYTFQIATGMAAAHQQDVVHRDLKPENLFLTRDGRIKILDFGLAKLTRLTRPAPVDEQTESRPSGTDSGGVAGTAGYMSPEQVRGLPVDPRSDIFSLGVVLYEMLTGKRAFRGDTAVETMTAILREDPPSLSGLNRGVPKSVERLVGRCLEKRPEDRFQSSRDLALALEALSATSPAQRRRAERRDEHDAEPSPYPGLASFTEDDAEHLFGRDDEIDALIQKLQGRNLLAVIGPSGTGKTSFLRAGLVPALPDGWRAVVCHPGDSPLVALAQALVPELADDTDVLRNLVRLESVDVAVAAVDRWRKRNREALLIVDAFEELFTLNSDETQSLFAKLLARLASEADVHVLLSMRDDFLFDCHAHPALAPIFTELTPLGPPTGTALRSALVEPATRHGYRFEDEALVEEMLSEVSEERGALPLLAFAVSRLWEHRDRKKALLTREAYAEIGGVAGALAQHAERTLERIGSELESFVREIFRNLVTAQGTRAASGRDELLSVFPDREAAAEVLDALIDARLLTSYELPATETAEGQTQHRVEIVHESLLEAWPRLVRWQAQDDEGALLRDQLKQAVRTWDERDRSADLLWSGAAFREFEVWRERYPGGLSASEAAFADAMAIQARRRQRKTRLAVAAAFTLLVTVLVVVSVSRQQAVSEARRAEASKLLAGGQSELDTDPAVANPTTALAYALASLELRDDRQARRLALEALWRGPTAFHVGGSFSSTALSADGTWLAITDAVPGDPVFIRRADGKRKDVQLTPQERSTLLQLQLPELRFVPNGNLLAMKGARGVHLLSPDSGKLVRSFAFESDAMALFQDQEQLLILQQEGARILVHTQPLNGGEPRLLGQLDAALLEKTRRAGGFRAAASTALLAAAKGNIVRLFDLNRLGAGGTVLGKHERTVQWLEIDPSGEVLAVAEEGGAIRLWSLSSGSDRPFRVLQGPTGVIARLQFDPTTRKLAALAAGPKSSVWIWDLRGPPAAAPLVLHRSDSLQISQLAFSAGGRWLASAGMPEGTSLWPTGRNPPMVLSGHEGKVWDVVFLPDGGALASASGDGTIRIWPLRPRGSERSRVLFERAEGLFMDLDVDPKGRYLLTAGSGGEIWVIPLDGGEPRQLLGFEDEVVPVALSPDGRLAAAAGGHHDGDYRIRLWDVETGDVLRVLGPVQELREGGSAFMGLRFTPDGRRLVTSGWTGIRLWNLEDGSSEFLGEGVGTAITRDGRTLYFGSATVEGQGRVGVYDLETRELSPLPTYGTAYQTALGPTGRILVSGGWDGVLRVGSVSGGEPHLLLGHEGSILRVAVSPDGRWIASGGADGSVRVWPMPDIDKPPLHTLSYEELLDRLRSLTNFRVVPDQESATGYKIDYEPFRGWASFPEW